MIPDSGYSYPTLVELIELLLLVILSLILQDILEGWVPLVETFHCH